MKKNKIGISLIHNNNPKRLSAIRPNIDKLIFELSKNNVVNFFEINWQPELKPVNFKIGVFRDFLYWKLNRVWDKYKKINSKFFILDIFVLIFRLLEKYIFNPKLGEKWLLSCSIEMFVTDKHVRAIFKALDDDCDYLLVFEDDSVFKYNSIKNLISLLDIFKDVKDVPLYVDLAGGCSQDVLEYNNILLKKDDVFKYFSRPVTNTACCYLLNKNQLKIFGDFLTHYPKLRYIGIDWLFNKMFIMQLINNKNSICAHSDPTFFKHGSVSGDFKAWIR